MSKNEEQILDLQQQAKKVSQIFTELNLKQVVLLHHNDCDGLTSGAILAKCFERRHLRVLRYCLEKPYPEVLAEIFDNPLLEDNCAIVFVDFGSGMLTTITGLNKRQKPVFVIDHHKIEEGFELSNTEKLFILNCRNFGLDGSIDCSASALAYLFAICLDDYNQDLQPLALLGAIGDGQYTAKNCFTGLNHEYYKELLNNKAITDDLKFLAPHNLVAEHFVECLNALGSFAYLSKGPDIALKGLAEGFDVRYQELAQKAINEFEKVYSEWVSSFKVSTNDKVQWFYLPDEFSAFGVKTVGLVCERLLKENKVSDNHFLVGFQKVPEYIPGLSPIKFSSYKLSMRLSSKLREFINTNPQASLDNLLPHAIKKVSGFVDACHPHAAAATVVIGKELELIDAIDNQLKLI